MSLTCCSHLARVSHCFCAQERQSSRRGGSAGTLLYGCMLLRHRCTEETLDKG